MGILDFLKSKKKEDTKSVKTSAKPENYSQGNIGEVLEGSLGDSSDNSSDNSSDIGFSSDNGELIAVITAALEAYTGRSSASFTVRSLRKVPSWNEAARKEQQIRFY